MGDTPVAHFHSFTNHLFLYILRENRNCWSRNRQYLADSEHWTHMCCINARRQTHILVYKVTISQRNKQLIRK